MKDKNYIKKISTIAEADIKNGNLDKVKRFKKKCIDNEDYETCEGIKIAEDKNQKN